MDDSILTNPQLIKYWELLRGEKVTRLSVADVMSMGVHVTIFEVYPRKSDAIYWNDGFTQLELNGVVYQSFPDLVQDSLPSFSEEKGISNDSIDFTISNVDNATRIMAMSGQLDKAQLNIGLIILNPYDSTPIYQQRMFTGFIENFQCTVNPFSEINEMKVTVNSVYKRLDLSPKTLAANSVYQSYYPNDAIMSLLGQVNKEDQVWRYK
ncbi:DUF2163 domain-containing protein [Citrobacter sp. S39]|uniref:DUF2163 domain-containing protein n=1 Tax=Citrobacter TaxID=544 RepID=UPI0012A86AD5|nr:MULTISPECIES: DUF2163 domain-containing protein [Citrobacter]MDX7507805.1 DUF2163 domain-containing protein [Citrobacter freundii]QFX90387.1 DUF2163 domain-containing protein [Citrobacter sp. S39]